MSDTQFGFFNKNIDFKKETINFESAINSINRLAPAFVVVSGDLINLPGDSVQIAEYKRIANKLNPKIPLYNIPGNHELTNEPTDTTLKDYNREFGPDFYSFHHGTLLGIVLNSTIIKEPSNVPLQVNKQFDWLVATLKKAKIAGYKHIVVFQHHPWFLTNPEEQDQYFNIPIDTRKIYLELFNKYGVSHIFAGHLHKNSYGKSKSLEMVTTGPVGRPLGNDPSGLRIIEVKNDSLKHTYYSLDSIPGQIEW